MSNNTKTTKILDQYGQPIDSGMLAEPQTARINTLQNTYLTPMLGGLTPARLARTLQEADNGNLVEQHRLFSDMEERDAHLRAEMDKRKNAVASLPWDIVPPRNPSSAELATTEWVREVLQDAADPIEDMLLALMEGPGHGFAAVELEWRQQGRELLPSFHPRPQEWFRLNSTRSALTLIDASVDGTPLNPFGWVMHTHGKAKSGYQGRMGLYRTLVWPFLYKAYALGDFAEFLETYGLPIIVGKYFAGASADEKASLMRAVTALGHDARAIMPAGMTLEINEASAKGGDSAHLAMVNWADKSVSKGILGQTLSADTGSKGGGSFALGKVHNEVRHDIMRGDARQIAATLTRDLIYPLIALNRPGLDGLARCPRFVLDVAEADDMAAYADALPKLVGVGFQIPRTWAQEKLHIPLAQKGEEMLSLPANAPVAPGTSETVLKAALSSQVEPDAIDPVDPTVPLVDQLSQSSAPHWTSQIDHIKSLVESSTSLEALQTELLTVFGGQPQEALVSLMAAAFALAELKGISDIMDEARSGT
jgi:phage gp29-like protein